MHALAHLGFWSSVNHSSNLLIPLNIWQDTDGYLQTKWGCFIILQVFANCLIISSQHSVRLYNFNTDAKAVIKRGKPYFRNCWLQKLSYNLYYLQEKCFNFWNYSDVGLELYNKEKVCYQFYFLKQRRLTKVVNNV